MSGGRNPFSGFGNGDPFGMFGGPFGNSGGPFGNSGGPFSNSDGLRGFGALNGTGLFGQMDPFGHPFFRNPMASMFDSNMFGPIGGSLMNDPFMNPAAFGFLEHERPPVSFMNSAVYGLLENELHPASSLNAAATRFVEHEHPLEIRSRGPVIEELSSDEEEGGKGSGYENLHNPRKHARSSNEPFVEFPDDETAEKKSKSIPQRREIDQMQHLSSQPQSHSFTFQTSNISYGNGTYYTSSRTRMAGSDGLTFEECKEANASTGQAMHRVSKGIHEKGHSVTRKLKSDGYVDTMQTLHNLDEEELANFEEAWKGNARKNPLGLTEGVVTGPGSSSHQRPRSGGLALPSTEGFSTQGNLRTGDAAHTLPRNPQRRRNNSDGTGTGN